jgi:hypothetical protein
MHTPPPSSKRVLKTKFVPAIKNIAEAIKAALFLDKSEHSSTDVSKFILNNISLVGATIDPSWDYFLYLDRASAINFIDKCRFSSFSTSPEPMIIFTEFMNKEFEHLGFQLLTYGLPEYNYMYKTFVSNALECDKYLDDRDKVHLDKVLITKEPLNSWSLFIQQCDKLVPSTEEILPINAKIIGDSQSVTDESVLLSEHPEHISGYAVYMMPLIIDDSSPLYTDLKDGSAQSDVGAGPVGNSEISTSDNIISLEPIVDDIRVINLESEYPYLYKLFQNPRNREFKFNMLNEGKMKQEFGTVEKYGMDDQDTFYILCEHVVLYCSLNYHSMSTSSITIRPYTSTIFTESINPERRANLFDVHIKFTEFDTYYSFIYSLTSGNIKVVNNA